MPCGWYKTKKKKSTKLFFTKACDFLLLSTVLHIYKQILFQKGPVIGINSFLIHVGDYSLIITAPDKI